MDSIKTLGEAVEEKRRRSGYGRDEERELFRLMSEAVFSLERILDRWDEWEKCES